MFRKTVNGNITDEDFKKILIPFNDNHNKFLEIYIMPEVIAFYIANSFYRDTMWKGSFKQHYNSAADVINFFNDDYFVIGDAFPVASNTITSRKNRNCKLSNVPQTRIHDFRHSCASLLVNNGANITVVAKYLGHTKIEETLNTYTHLFNSALNEVVELIDKLE